MSALDSCSTSLANGDVVSVTRCTDGTIEVHVVSARVMDAELAYYTDDEARAVIQGLAAVVQ